MITYSFVTPYTYSHMLNTQVLNKFFSTIIIGLKIVMKTTSVTETVAECLSLNAHHCYRSTLIAIYGIIHKFQSIAQVHSLYCTHTPSTHTPHTHTHTYNPSPYTHIFVLQCRRNRLQSQCKQNSIKFSIVITNM